MKDFCNGNCYQGRKCDCAIFKASWWTLFCVLVMLALLVVGLRMSPEAADWIVDWLVN